MTNQILLRFFTEFSINNKRQMIRLKFGLWLPFKMVICSILMQRYEVIDVTRNGTVVFTDSGFML